MGERQLYQRVMHVILARVEPERGVHRDTQQMSGMIHVGAGQMVESIAFRQRCNLADRRPRDRHAIVEFVVATEYAEGLDGCARVGARLFWAAVLGYIRP